jgi:hypothetical protein
MVKIRGELEKTFGSLDNVRKNAQLVGVDIDKAFGNIGRGVKGVDEFNRVVGQFEEKWNALDGAMKRYGITVDDITNSNKTAQQKFGDFAKEVQSDWDALVGAGMNPDEVIRRMAGGLNDLIIAAKDAGGKVPEAMVPVLERMNELGLLTDAAKNKLLGLTDENAVDFQKMEEIAKNYGVSLEALGPKFDAAKITSEANQIIQDFKFLQDSGADAGGVLAGMSDEISNIVQRAMKAHVELPEAFRPMIQVLADSGQLLDENGQAIKDLSGIAFAKPIEDQFGRIVDAIKELGDKLSGDLPKKFNSGLDSIQESAKNRKIQVDVDVNYNDPGFTPSAAARGGLVTDTGVQYLASGGLARILGFRPRGTDTVPAMLTPGEGVINRRGMDALSAINRGEVGGSIVIEKGAIVVNGADDPEAVAEAIVRKVKATRKFGRRAA